MSARHSPTDAQRWKALLFISIAQLMVILDGAVMNIALPSAQEALHFTDGSRQWVITAYGLAFGGLLLVGGRIGDMVGRKRVFLIALAGFAVASAIGGLAVNAPMLLIARALQGVFAALLAPAALSLISLSFTRPRERATAFGVFAAVSVAGGAVGLIAGGLLTQYLNWRFSHVRPGAHRGDRHPGRDSHRARHRRAAPLPARPARRAAGQPRPRRRGLRVQHRREPRLDGRPDHRVLRSPACCCWWPSSSCSRGSGHRCCRCGC